MHYKSKPISREWEDQKLSERYVMQKRKQSAMLTKQGPKEIDNLYILSNLFF